MITLRLDPVLEEEINTTAKNLGLTKSELIRKSILEYLDKLEAPDAYELGKTLFGRYASGVKNLSVDRKAIIKGKIQGKRK